MSVRKNLMGDDTNRSFLNPKITSTPLNSIFATPPKNPIMTPRRYSLSELATPPRSNRRDYLRLKSNYPPGPILASTTYNVNVGTFEDTKSPGLVNRIVQYHEETERHKEQRHPATHQAKYGTVGLFPVVHLFKNRLPVLEKKPRHVTVRVATPDYMKHSPEYSRRILEGLVKPSGDSQRLSHSSFSENSTSTRSVLDALKEISRKRIHANEELELHEDTGKRLRKESDNFTDSNKRLRDDSPLLETSISPSKPASKKICMYDEYAASRSSTDFVFDKVEATQPKRKSISISTLTENHKESKQVKLINAETQTIEEESNVSLPAEEEDKEKEIEKDPNNALKVFDDAPLERIRKNRLAALMGTLVGKQPILEPKPDYATLLRDTTNEPENQNNVKTVDKPLKSILSPSQKSLHKIDKHVTFNIPEGISQNNSNNLIASTTLSCSTTYISVANEVDNKIVDSATVVKESSTAPSFSLETSTSKPTNLIPSTTSTIENSTPGPILFPPKSISAVTPKTIPSFNFGGNKSVTSSSISTSESVVTSSPPKTGGFKFNLTNPPTVTTTLVASTPDSVRFSHANMSSVNSFAITTSVSIFSTPIVSASAAPSSKIEVTSNTRPVYGGTISSVTSPFNAPSSNQPFAVSSVSNTKPSFSFGPLATSTASNSTFKFGKPEATTANSTTFAFAKTTSDATTTAGFASGGISNVNTSAKTSFGTITSVANKGLNTSSFGKPSAAPSFGGGTFGNNFQSVKSDTGINFGNPVATSSSASFGSNNAGFGNLTKSGGFNSTFGATNSNTPSFGVSTSNFATTTASSFGTKTTSGFGVTSTTSFGTTTTSGFGVTSTTSFGTTTASGFGVTQTPSFGTTTNSGFGTTSAGFGNSTTSGFGSGTTTSSGFRPSVTSANIFGAPSVSSASFGGDTFNSPVGSSPFGTAATVNSGFGIPTTSSGGFGGVTTNPAGFGTVTTQAFTFGPSSTSSTSNAFGIATATTTATPGFGTTTTSGFGPNPGSIFASANPSFGGSSSLSFGSTSSGSFSETPFGAPATSTSVFGTVTTTSSFNYGGATKLFGGANKSFGPTPTTTSSVFSTTQSPFNSGAVTTSASVLPFNFSAKTTANNTFPATNTVTPSFGSTFGQTNTGFGTQSTGFGSSNKVSSTFGNATPAFGNNSAAPAFGSIQQQTPQFGTAGGSVFHKPQTAPPNAFGSAQFNFNQQQNSTPNQSSVFTFGSGGPEKPGVFNFNGSTPGEVPNKFDFAGGNNAPTAFGTSFGNTPAVPSFGASPSVAPGGFSIGSGPPASSRPRTQIKAKRRT